MDVEQIKVKIVPILKSAGVTRSSLFGSVVRGEATESSDVDVLVEFPKGKTLLDLVRLQNELEGALDRRVDVLTYKSLHHLFRDEVLKSQVPIL
ncbi:hypothetical protein A2755_03470 [Candidatus Wolfebacteria bacterium RIFCSPHIGHO2_01_FULL_48_22]|uniref:Polymerase nucleotidyl transferase domain-containing protein n=2 Tax=Candidatus Wolfeibacteriota TaxID=1752735 RepID=A0A1F8DPN9_9BACT|nr:MAG: hypothetical protein A2755_03470 [Candidatus Wolfebacteria bacterium RIFCSPHIGHO2_01_FULL_48_22]OGM92087.1 MAG: hypothetical protein A2935_01960 [Candidatus Wolfebacteria bacterium RIFCSPLOWO2_01_FULL_47_17b]